jgi:hypothetical protein
MTDARRAEAVRNAFRRVFGSEGNRSQDQLVVMAWLERFCRKHACTFTGDRDAALFLEGRREVLLEIERRVGDSGPSLDEILGIPPDNGETDD